MSERPDYIKENADGSVTVELNDGRSIHMREPTVDDQLATKGTPEQREIAMVSNLCELAPSEIGKMTARNYRRLQQALLGFLD